MEVGAIPRQVPEAAVLQQAAGVAPDGLGGERREYPLHLPPREPVHPPELLDRDDGGEREVPVGRPAIDGEIGDHEQLLLGGHGLRLAVEAAGPPALLDGLDERGRRLGEQVLGLEEPGGQPFLDLAGVDVGELPPSVAAEGLEDGEFERAARRRRRRPPGGESAGGGWAEEREMEDHV